ncbi:MAG: tetratricopeptide repeat protein [Myxococcales bacterium]|nr:tetratricopeptide repeat protein [Myxococcales bacterium]
MVLAALLCLAPPAEAALDDAARAEIMHQRGARALRSGDTAEAIDWFNKSLELRPDQAETLALYARALLEAGRPADAEQVTQRLRAIHPGDSDVIFLLAVTAYRQQDWITARRYLEEARAAHPRDARVRLYLGRAYQELGEDTNAEQELIEASRLDPDFQGPAAYRLAILHLQRNESDEAKRFFEEVRAIDPDSELAKSAGLYLKLMQERAPQRFSYWAKLGFAYDSNMTLAGAGDLVAQSDEAGYRGSLEVGFNGKLFQWKQLSMRAGITNYVSYHDKEHEFDIQQVRPWLLTTWRPLEMLAFDVRLTHEQVWRNYHHFKSAHFVQPAIRWTPLPGWLSRAFYEYENRNYHDAFELIPTRDRDGSVQRIGFDQYIPLPNPFDDGPAYFRIGYRYRIEASNGHHFDSRSHKPLATIGFSLPYDMNLTVDASWERRAFARESFFEVARELGGFQQPQPLRTPTCNFTLPPAGAFAENFAGCKSNSRLDRVTQSRVRLRKNIGKHWTVEGWYRWVDWESDTQEFDFDRHIVGMAATFRR